MGKLLDVLGVSTATQSNLPSDVLDGELFIIGLQKVYENSPESANKDNLANTIAETIRLLLLEVKKYEVVNSVLPQPTPQPTPQPIPQVQPQPTPQIQTRPQVQPQVQVQPQPQPQPTPPPTKPKKPRPPKPVSVQINCSRKFCVGDDTSVGKIEEIWRRPDGTFQYLCDGTYYDEKFVLPLQPSTPQNRQAELDALENELNELEEAIVIFDVNEPEYQELIDEINKIKNQIINLTP
jgi:hypothetical protein